MLLSRATLSGESVIKEVDRSGVGEFGVIALIYGDLGGLSWADVIWADSRKENLS